MNKAKVRYIIKNGHLYCEDGVFDRYEVECTVELFLQLLEEEETY